MEAPEKIYVCDNVFPNHVDWEGSPINTKRIDNCDVEYIRKDVFIQKVINFLNNKLDNVVATRVFGTIIPHHVGKRELIDDFKKYIKE